MPAPYQVTTSGETTSLSYSPQRKIEQLCDGSYLALVQTAVDTLKLVQITNPSGTPTFTTLTQTFTFASASNTIGDLFILNNSTTTSDVWVAWSDNSSNTGLYVAHGTYTASGSSWSWDNTSTSIALGTVTGGFMIPSIAWTGSNLIIVARGNSGNYEVVITSTPTKNGSSSWTALAALDASGAGTSHYYPLLLHDATNTCTLCVYTVAGDTVYARVIADASTPSVANWSSAVALSSTVNVGAANLSAVLDTTNKRLHVVYDNTSVATNPYYNSATYTTTSISAGTSFSVDSAAATFTGPTIALDGASNPTAYLFWGSGAVGAASDIIYAKIASPYGAGNVTSTTNLTNNTATDNTYPHLPTITRMGAFVPLLYAHTVSAWAIEYDNSIVLSSIVSGSCTLQSNAVIAAPATLTATPAAPAALADAAQLTNTLVSLTGNGVITGFSSITAFFAGNSVFTVTGSVVVAVANVLVTPPLAGQSLAVSPVAQLTSNSVAQKSPTPPQFLFSNSALTLTGAVVVAPITATPPLVENSVAAPTIATLAAQSALIGLSVPAGTGIGGLAVTTKSQSWSNISGNPGPGTEYDVTYKDAAGAGWQIGLIPSYGGMPISSWYEIDGNTVGANQTSLATTFPDGHLHWLEANPGGNYAGSEDLPFGMTELAPSGTDFRRYYQCSFGPDSNGFYWQGWACAYPGDPGFIGYRFDLINQGTSAISLQGFSPFSLALIAGLEQADSNWAYTNGGYGTLAGGLTTPLPVASANGNPVNGDVDYVYIAPAAASSMQIGQLTVKQKPVANLTPSYISPQLTVLANSARMKIALNFDITGSAFPANTTSTMYLLNVMRRSLTSTDAIAIAADYLNPGTPTTTLGSFTTFSYDEIAYVFAASNNQVSATLDLSPAHVSARYKPRYKITGWTAGSPQLFWGGVQLTANVDYRSTVDTVNHILYLHLYADVVTANAIAPSQRNNAVLLVQAQAVQGTIAFVGNSGLAQTGVAALIASAGVDALVAQAGILAPSQIIVTAGGAAIAGQSAIATSVTVGAAPASLIDDTQLQQVLPQALPSNSAIAAAATIGAAIVAGSGNLIGNAAIATTVSVTDPGPEAVVANAALAVSAGQLVAPAYGSVSLAASSALVATGVTLNQLIGSSALSITTQAAVGAAPAALAAQSVLTETNAITFIATNDPLAANATLTVTGVILICGAGAQDTLVAQSVLANAAGVAEGVGTLVATSTLATPTGEQIAAAPLALPAASTLPAVPATITVSAGAAALVGNNTAFVTSVLIIGGSPDLLVAQSVIVESGGAQIATPSSSSVALAEAALIAEATQLVVAAGNASLVANATATTNPVSGTNIIANGPVALAAQSALVAPAQIVTTLAGAPLAGNAIIAAQASQGVNNVQIVATSVLAASATVVQNPPGAFLAAVASLVATPETVDPALVAVAGNATLTITGVILSAAPADAPLPAQSTTAAASAQIAVAPADAPLVGASGLVAFALLIATALTGQALVAANAAAQAHTTLVDPATPLVGASAVTLTGPLTVQGVAQLAATALVAQQSAFLIATLAALPLASASQLTATPQGFAGLALSVGILSARTARAVLLARTAQTGLTARNVRATLTSLP